MKKNTKKTKRDVNQEITNKFVELLEAGVCPWDRPWKSSYALPLNYATGKEYRGVNVLILSVAAMTKGYSSNAWLTFKQAKEKGGHVRKGEKATTVVFWNTIKREETTTSGDTKEVRIPFARAYSVFNLEQIEGIEIPNNDDAKIDPIERAEELVAAYLANGPSLTHGGNRAAYSPSTDKISLPPRNAFESAEAYYLTLFHEVVHSTGSHLRLSRIESTNYGTDEYGNEELVAELGATFLAAHCGILEPKETTRSAAYLGSWIKRLKANPKLIVQAAQRAQKAVDLVVGANAPTKMAEAA